MSYHSIDWQGLVNQLSLNNLNNPPSTQAFLPDAEQSNINLPILFFDANSNNLFPYKEQPGITLFMLACYSGNMNLAQQLIEKGADIHHQNWITAQNSLWYVIASNQSSDVKANFINLLIDKNINLLARDYKDHSILHWCVKYNDLESLKLIIERLDDSDKTVLDFNITDENNMDLCPILYAMKCGYLDIADCLLTMYADHKKFKFFSNPTNNEWSMEPLKKILGNADAEQKNKLVTLMKTHGLAANKALCSTLGVNKGRCSINSSNRLFQPVSQSPAGASQPAVTLGLSLTKL